LHGLYDSRRAWRRVAPMLASRSRVLMPDLPGSGSSDRPDAPYSLSWMADIVSRWMQTIGVEKAHVCGHSFGGGIAQWMLLEHRARIDRLALVSAGGLGREVAWFLRLAALPVLGPTFSPLVLRVVIPAVLRYRPDQFGDIEPEERSRYVEAGRIPGTARAFSRSVTGVINVFGQYRQMRDRVGDVAQLPPIALFWGADDPLIPSRHGHDMVADFEHVSLVIYERCGHFPQLERAERFASDLSSFLSDPDRRAARMPDTLAPVRAGSPRAQG
jgi:pimeloyl-ACP methyl ester carboxylesterase